MVSNVYEGMFILDSNKYARDAASISGQIPEMIQNLGGEILANRLWEDRRLAYPIGQHKKGAYWLTYFRLDPSKLSDLSRECRINESIIRTLFLKVEPRLVEVLVSHALQGPAVRRPEPVAAIVADLVETEDLDVNVEL